MARPRPTTHCATRERRKRCRKLAAIAYVLVMPELAARAPAPTPLTRDAWNQLLRALDPDAVQAASRYEQLRQHLIGLYRVRGLPCPEDLADQALDHVACRLVRGALGEGELAPYLRGVARQIADDAGRLRRRERAPDPADPAQLPAWPDDDPLARLCRCLDALPRSDRWTLLEYETGIGYERIRRRKAVAAELGIPMNALRVRVHRLRARVIAMMRADDAGLTSWAAAAAAPAAWAPSRAACPEPQRRPRHTGRPAARSRRSRRSRRRPCRRSPAGGRPRAA